MSCDPASTNAARRRLWRPLGGVLVFSLVIRAVWGQMQSPQGPGFDVLGDQRDYLEIAQNLLNRGEFRFFDARFGQDVYAFRPPGYPIMLAACGANVRVARGVQAIIDTATVLAVFLLARRWLDRRRALAAAALVAVNPFLIYFSGLILTETLFTSLLVWGTLLIVYAGQRGQRSAGYLLGGCAVLAVAALVRPSVMLLPSLLAAAATVALRPKTVGQPTTYSLLSRFPAVVAMLMVLLALSPWAYRNSRALGQWIWTTTNGGITAYDGLHDGATGASDQAFVTKMTFLKSPQMSEIGRDEYFAAAARQWAREHPGQTAALAVIKAGRTWTPAPLSREFGKSVYRIVAILYAVPFDLLVVIGLYSVRLPRSAKLFLLIPAVYVTLTYAFSVGSLRYRIPVEPLLAVIAASGLTGLIADKQSE